MPVNPQNCMVFKSGLFLVIYKQQERQNLAITPSFYCHEVAIPDKNFENALKFRSFRDNPRQHPLIHLNTGQQFMDVTPAPIILSLTAALFNSCFFLITVSDIYNASKSLIFTTSVGSHIASCLPGRVRQLLRTQQHEQASFLH